MKTFFYKGFLVPRDSIWVLQICLPQEGLIVSHVESMDIFHRCWPRMSTNLEAGGDLASLACQVD